MSVASVLVVEDDADLRTAVVETLTNNGFNCCAAEDGRHAITLLEETQISAVISDVQMPHTNGLELLDKMRHQFPKIPVLLMTAYGSIDKAVLAIKQGAYDYLAKPFDSHVLLDKLQFLLDKNMALSLSETEEEKELKNSGVFFQDPKSKAVFALAKRVAQSDSSVMITGPSGTGKEVLSRYIHDHSKRSEAPFVALNCAAIPENMLEAILFGYEKGAFTGAYQAAPGKFEQAHGGTILLDEITEMPLLLQSKLLRVLQEREVERLGGKKIIKIDVRVIATSNRDLTYEVSQKQFREDLFYRLNVFPLQISPLAQRRLDILPIAEYFIRRYSPTDHMVELSEEAKTLLLEYPWPGNVRQLENVIQRALVLCPSGVIHAKDLMLESIEIATDKPILETSEGLNRQEEAVEGLLGEDLKKREYSVILDTLKKHQGSRKETANTLGISSRTLRYKMAKMREMGCDFSQVI